MSNLLPEGIVVHPLAHNPDGTFRQFQVTMPLDLVTEDGGFPLLREKIGYAWGPPSSTMLDWVRVPSPDKAVATFIATFAVEDEEPPSEPVPVPVAAPPHIDHGGFLPPVVGCPRCVIETSEVMGDARTVWMDTNAIDRAEFRNQRLADQLETEQARNQRLVRALGEQTAGVTKWRNRTRNARRRAVAAEQAHAKTRDRVRSLERALKPDAAEEGEFHQGLYLGPMEDGLRTFTASLSAVPAGWSFRFSMQGAWQVAAEQGTSPVPLSAVVQCRPPLEAEQRFQLQPFLSCVGRTAVVEDDAGVTHHMKVTMAGVAEGGPFFRTEDPTPEQGQAWKWVDWTEGSGHIVSGCVKVLPR